MYTFNLFCFGHELAQDPELNNLLNEYDFDLRHKINGRQFEVNFPYHGGQCRGDVYSCVFGTQISDSDFNPNFVKEIRSAKYEDYIDDYNQFIEWLKSEITTWDDEGIEEIAQRLITFLDTHKPDFYSVEASS